MKRVSDPVHGTIELSEVESAVISTTAFQRLRNVKHLGLGCYVFPGADYSRFSHLLGVCHVTGQILSALRTNSSEKISDAEEQNYRLAALLHDVGHYPFSHAMEEAIKDFYAEGLIRDKSLPGPPGLGTKSLKARFFNHEEMGKVILQNDSELKRVLSSAGIEPETIYRIFLREEPPRFANLISSDLDADRIDFLLRTAHHTGLPYGSVDLPYILSQMTLDSESRICLTAKAVRTIDHFLLCRYFDYQQVAFHKTVAAFEWLLKDTIVELLRSGSLDCSSQALISRLTSGSWHEFDDSSVMRLIRDLAEKDPKSVASRKGRAIIDRKPPKLVGEIEFLGERGEAKAKDLLSKKQMLEDKIPIWSSRFGIDPKLWHVWHNTSTLTKIGSSAPVSALAEVSEEDLDRQEQSVRILDRRSKKSEFVGQLKHSLMKVLSDTALYGLRIYVLLEDKKIHLRPSIENDIRADLPHIEWK